MGNQNTHRAIGIGASRPPIRYCRMSIVLPGPCANAKTRTKTNTSTTQELPRRTYFSTTQELPRRKTLRKNGPVALIFPLPKNCPVARPYARMAPSHLFFHYARIAPSQDPTQELPRRTYFSTTQDASTRSRMREGRPGPTSGHSLSV